MSFIFVVYVPFSDADNPCLNTKNPPCTSDGVAHTCVLKTDGTFTCACQKGFVNSGSYCIGRKLCFIRYHKLRDGHLQQTKPN